MKRTYPETFQRPFVSFVKNFALRQIAKPATLDRYLFVVCFFRHFEGELIFALLAFELGRKSMSDKPLRFRSVRRFGDVPIGLPVLLRAFDPIDVAPVKSTDIVIFGHSNTFDHRAEKCDLEAVNSVKHPLSLSKKTTEGNSSVTICGP